MGGGEDGKKLMEHNTPRIISNREFVEYEEEDIQRINREEALKYDGNPDLSVAMREIESRLGTDGHWEEHWLTLDESGSRVYARIYYTPDEAVGIAADGRVVRTMDYPNDEENLRH